MPKGDFNGKKLIQSFKKGDENVGDDSGTINIPVFKKQAEAQKKRIEDIDGQIH